MDIVFKRFDHRGKYVLSTRRKDAWIKIKVSVVDGILNMEVGNSCFRNAKSDQYIGGIGLKNVKKRLELNYDSKYNLDSKEEVGKYEVLLTVDLNRSKGTFKE